MGSSPPSESASPYHYQAFRQRRRWSWEGWETQESAVTGYDGEDLYETECSALKRAIIENDDAILLIRYLAKCPSSVGPDEVSYPENVKHFHLAASSGSTNALRVMLEHWAAQRDSLRPGAQASSWLLGAACASARIETAIFLMDESLPWAHDMGNIHGPEGTQNPDGTHSMSAILSAAEAYIATSETGSPPRHRLEETMRLLLDRGACARDYRPLAGGFHERRGTPLETPYHTVLSLAMAGASGDMIKRLVHAGADIHVHTTTSYVDQIFYGPELDAWDVTPLHIGSLHFNADGIQALLDCRASGASIADMVLCRDNYGRTPLHWAAGSCLISRMCENGHAVAEQRNVTPVIDTIKLLLAANPDTINIRDNAGDTPLHYAARNYKLSLETAHRSWFSAIFQVLFENGADASLRGSKGRAPLHRMLSRPNPYISITIDPAVVELFVAHGAKVSDTDSDGRTILHYAAQNLRAPQTVRFLLRLARSAAGGDDDDDDDDDDDLRGAVDKRGNTPLHVAAAEGVMLRVFPQSVTPEDRRRAQEEMMRALLPQPAKGEQSGQVSDGSLSDLMDRRNADGKTPRQLGEERARKWQQVYEARQADAALRAAGRGRGGGRGRGAAVPLDPQPWR